MNAQTVLQWKIEATQLLDDITYGLKSIKVCGGEDCCTGVHAGQLYRACEAAALFLDSTADGILHSRSSHCGLSYRDTEARLREAKKIAAETLKETKQAAKDFGFGTARQLRLGLAAEAAADTHEYALSA